jgi:selenocysteine-specific elongation factor
VHFHLGAIDVTARVALLEGATLAPGGAGLAQIVLDKPVGALHGDRFVLRDQSATRTAGGGIVLDPFPPQRGRRAATRLDVLRAWDAADPVVALQKLLQTSALGADLRHFRIAWNLDEGQLGELLVALPVRRVVDGGNLFAVDATHWMRLLERIEAALTAEHERAPDMVGVGRERLRRLTDPALMQSVFDAALRELLGAQRLAQSGSWLHHPQHQVKLTLADEALWGKVHPLLESQPFQPPRVRDLARALLVSEEDMRQFLKRTARLGLVYPVAHDHYFTRRAVGALAAIVRELNAQEGAATASRFRDRIDTGRKVAIHILEFFDRVGYTRRVGDTHLLRQPALFGEEAGLM